jgi:DNA-binding XRE family transcriptional regulator
MVQEPCIDLKAVRKTLGLGQSEFADALGTSLRTVQSCEQGWRNPGPAVEKAALLLLMVHHHGSEFGTHTCWESMQCSNREREACLVYQARQGHLCWLLSGHICKGIRLHSWEDKKKLCSRCDFFEELFPGGVPCRECEDPEKQTTE